MKVTVQPVEDMTEEQKRTRMSPSVTIEPTGEHKGTWTPEMKARLRAEYPQARADGKLRELADSLGVDLYQLYGQAHRLGLSREIRRR